MFTDRSAAWKMDTENKSWQRAESGRVLSAKCIRPLLNAVTLSSQFLSSTSHHSSLFVGSEFVSLILPTEKWGPDTWEPFKFKLSINSRKFCATRHRVFLLLLFLAAPAACRSSGARNWTYATKAAQTTTVTPDPHPATPQGNSWVHSKFSLQEKKIFSPFFL